MTAKKNAKQTKTQKPQTDAEADGARAKLEAEAKEWGTDEMKTRISTALAAMDDDVAKKTKAKLARNQSVVAKRVQRNFLVIARHHDAIEKLITKSNEAKARGCRRVTSILSKDDPRTKKIAKLARLQAQMAKLQAELEA